MINLDKRQELQTVVDNLKTQLINAQIAVDVFDYSPENHRYATIDDAYELEDVLRNRAHEDCEGSYNCGQPEYTQGFYVGDKEYEATAKVEYNRHDKTYYYIDGFDFSFKEVTV